MLWNILTWGLGLVALVVVAVLFLFVRDQMRLKAKMRRRWALAVGVPARLAALQMSERATKINAPDPEISVSIANFEDDKTWLKEQAIAHGYAAKDTEIAIENTVEQNRRAARARIRSCMANITARRMGWQPLDGYSVRDAMAWDASMLVEEVRLAETLGWLSEEEVWGYLFLNGQKVQDCFESWQDFSDSFLRGREFFLRITQGKHASPRLAQALAKKHADTLSSFSNVPWREFRVLDEADLVAGNAASKIDAPQ